MNKGLHGKYNCDACAAKLFIGPGNVKYCDNEHKVVVESKNLLAKTEGTDAILMELAPSKK